MSILNQKPLSPLKEGYGTKLAIGLIVALSLSLAAFQIQVPYQKPPVLEPFFKGDDGTITIETIASHTAEKEVEPPKPVKHQAINLIIDDASFKNAPVAPTPVSNLDLNTSLPDEGIVEAPIPVPITPVRIVSQMPVFPGGDVALANYLAQVPYCHTALQDGYEGKVYVEFIVGVDGYVTRAKLQNKLHPCIDRTVLAHVKNMPQWQPGYQGKNAVPVIMVVPFNFVTRPY